MNTRTNCPPPPIKVSMTTIGKPTSLRVDTQCPIFGKPNDQTNRCLPTYSDVMKCYLFERMNTKTSAKQPSLKDCIEAIIMKLISIWNRSPIPIVTEKRIYDMLKAYHSKYRSILKPFKSRQNDTNYRQKIDQFIDKANVLFDIAACKCMDACSCPSQKRVPQLEKNFLLDQRSSRKMAIANVDIAETKSNLRKHKKKHTISAFYHNEVIQLASSIDDDAESSDVSDFEKELSVSFSKSNDMSTSVSVNQLMKLPSLALISDRTGVSDRTAACIASATLTDYGVINKDDKSKVIDKNKVRRARSKLRNEVVSEQKVKGSLTSLYFDGRKDKTIAQVKRSNKMSKQVVTEEHVVIITEPGSKFIDHVTPKSGHSVEIASSILQSLQSNAIDAGKLQAIGCDGTAVNTGNKNGIIAILEKRIGKPLQWIICQLHANELPLRHLITKLEGKTTGPVGFTGKIGKQLKDCEMRPIVDFQRIPGEQIILDTDDLSTDQKYLLDVYHAVSSGNCSESMACRQPGKMAHSRWLTTANRILRLYMATESPDESFIHIVNFIMEVYTTMWFLIKCNSSISNASQHLFQTIRRIRKLDIKTQRIVSPVVQRNRYLAHPENMLICMISDSRDHVRKLGWRRIMKARCNNTTENIVRKFEVPAINFNANDYIDLINWQEITLTEPPLTRHIS